MAIGLHGMHIEDTRIHWLADHLAGSSATAIQPEHLIRTQTNTVAQIKSYRTDKINRFVGHSSEHRFVNDLLVLAEVAEYQQT